MRVGVAAILRPELARHTGASCTDIDRWSILLTRRRADAVYAGYWELPGGKIENDESPEQAAAREVLEEIGCTVDIRASLPPIEHVYEHAHVVLTCVVCALAPGSPAPRDLEVAEHAWVRLAELPWERFLPANVRLITALVRYLESEDQPRSMSSA